MLKTRDVYKTDIVVRYRDEIKETMDFINNIMKYHNITWFDSIYKTYDKNIEVLLQNAFKCKLKKKRIKPYHALQFPSKKLEKQKEISKRLIEKKSNGMENESVVEEAEARIKSNDCVEKTESNPQKSIQKKLTNRIKITNDMDYVTIGDYSMETFYLHNEKLYTEHGHEIGWYELWLDHDGCVSEDYKDEEEQVLDKEDMSPLYKYHITNGYRTTLLEQIKKCSQCKGLVKSTFKNATCNKAECRSKKATIINSHIPKTYTAWVYDEEYDTFNRNTSVRINEL